MSDPNVGPCERWGDPTVHVLCRTCTAAASAQEAPSQSFTRQSVERWMRSELQARARHYNGNATFLAENAAEAFGKKDVGGPLDDADHWIWDAAVEAIAWYGKGTP